MGIFYTYYKKQENPLVWGIELMCGPLVINDLLSDYKLAKQIASEYGLEFKDYDLNLGKEDESEEKLISIYKGLPIPTVTWKKVENDFILINYNTAVDKYTKGFLRKYLGTTASEFHHNRPDILNDIYRCFNEKKFISREMEYFFEEVKDVRYLTVIYGHVPPDLVIIHMVDITDRILFEKELKESEQKYRQDSLKLKFLNLIISVGNEATDLQTFLNNVLSRTLRLLDLDGGGIYVNDAEKNRNVLASHLGFSKEFINIVRITDVTKEPFASLIKKQRPLILEDA